MKVTLTLTVLVVAAVTNVNAQESKLGAGRDLAGSLLKVIENAGRSRAVVVENWTGANVRVWCASKDNRIKRNGMDYIDLKDQDAMGWSFTPNVLPGFSGNTLFWCTICYKSQKRGWKVYDEVWEKQNSGVPDNGLLRWRIIYDSVRWEYEPLKAGWDFKNWPSDGSC